MPSAKIISNKTTSISLNKTRYESLIKQVPSVVNNVLRFEFNDANCALANAIRRTIMSELPIRHLTVSLSDIKSTDPYIIGEAIRKRIEMIPISQSTNLDSVFSIRFENNTDEYIDVMSSEIKLNGVMSSKDIVPFIPICDINSKTSISINDIRVVESFGFDNSRASVGRVAYEILDADFNQPSTVAVPTKFQLEIETPGVINPIEIVSKSIQSLIERIDSIDYSRSITEFGIYKLTIPNETFSIGKLFSWYIYKVDPTIKYVASRIVHPSKRECIIDVHHSAGEDMCKKAAEIIKNDLKSLAKTFA